MAELKSPEQTVEQLTLWISQLESLINSAVEQMDALAPDATVLEFRTMADELSRLRSKRRAFRMILSFITGKDEMPDRPTRLNPQG